MSCVDIELFKDIKMSSEVYQCRDTSVRMESNAINISRASGLLDVKIAIARDLICQFNTLHITIYSKLDDGRTASKTQVIAI